MRIRDVSPAYLNRQSLLGEHRELHGLVSILINNKIGYSRHPETLRWTGFGWALKQRHKMIAAEMSLRGYRDKSPVLTRSNSGKWPEDYIDTPFNQLSILNGKYQNKEAGRLAIPENSQQMWSQHKYSILARDPNLYKSMGSQVSSMKPGDNFSLVAQRLSEALRHAPSTGGTRNALQHMWGYISEHSDYDKRKINTAPLSDILSEIQKHAMKTRDSYLFNSTALGELEAWI